MSKPKIVWLGVHSEKILKIMKENEPEGFTVEYVKSKTDREEHLALLKDADYVSPNGIKMTKEYISAAPKLKLIQSWSAGTDGIDLEACRNAKVAVYSGAGLNAAAVAEMTILLILAVNRHLPYVDRTLRTGKWLKTEMRERCNSVYGKTVGLIGMGNIAQKVAQYLHGMDVEEIIYYDIKRLSPEKENQLNVRYAPFEEVVSKADILSLHVPSSPQTQNMIGKEQLESMKRDAILINTARGKLVDEPALIEALKNGTIRGAGLDTYNPEPPLADNPLFGLENVVLTSHGGGAVIENVLPRVMHVYNNIQKFERGETLDSKFEILACPKKHE